MASTRHCPEPPPGCICGVPGAVEWPHHGSLSWPWGWPGLGPGGSGFCRPGQILATGEGPAVRAQLILMEGEGLGGSLLEAALGGTHPIPALPSPGPSLPTESSEVGRWAAGVRKTRTEAGREVLCECREQRGSEGLPSSPPAVGLLPLLLLRFQWALEPQRGLLAMPDLLPRGLSTARRPCLTQVMRCLGTPMSPLFSGEEGGGRPHCPENQTPSCQPGAQPSGPEHGASEGG